MITINALDELSNSREYDLALMTTFNLDVDFFERFIAGRIYGNEIKKIALFVDAKELIIPHRGSTPVAIQSTLTALESI